MAVNKNENAPIFEMADYGVVGNLYDIAGIEGSHKETVGVECSRTD